MQGSAVSFGTWKKAAVVAAFAVAGVASAEAQAKPAAPAKGAPAKGAPAKPAAAPQAQTTAPAQPQAAAPPVKPEPIFPATKEEKAQFAVEYVVNFTRRAYQPQVTIENVRRANASYNTPEETLIAQFSAMRAGDYDWWISGWDPKSQQQMRDRDQQLKRGASFWRNAWEKNLTNRQVNLVERLESGVYVLLVYTLSVPSQDNRLDFRGLMVLKKEGDRWLQTQELGNDLLFQHYTQGAPRISRDTFLQPYPAQTAEQIEKEGAWRGAGAQQEFMKAYAQGRPKVTHVVR